MGEIKEVLLQMLIAGVPAFLFPLTYGNCASNLMSKERGSSKNSHSVGLLYTCTVSMLLCSIFSTRLWDEVPINYGILPLFALMLYGRLRDGIALALIQLLLYPLFALNFTFSGMILETGMLLYPMVLLASNYFKVTTRHGKVVTLSVFFVAGELMITSSPFMTGTETLRTDLYSLAAAVVNILVTLLIGALFIYMIEHTLEKEKLRLQVMQLSRNYFREAEKLQQSLDAAPLSIILLDREGDIMAINETFLRLYRRSDPTATRENLIRHKLNTVLTNIQFEVLISRSAQTLEGNAKTRELLQSGDQIYFTSTSPIKKGHTDETVGAVLIIQDITELETFRKELNHIERLSLVGQMAAGITHEIRNPMAVVRGFLQLMREKSPSSLDHYYRIVMEELDRANSIINDFLSLAQNRSVKMELCSLHEIIKELTPLLWADANLRGQSIEVMLDEEVPELLLNQKEIKQLILNLGRNGMEAMDEKGQLILETKCGTDGVELYVKDTGAGISPAQQERLFEPFFTTKSQGTGLGLSLCLSIMERHSGKISVDSEEGKGTTFTVFFPFTQTTPSSQRLRGSTLPPLAD
ncbi:two-component system sensor histidine kinase NtrB [Fontibacillus sp. BL9]|uniref:two-component system sensor histidine kinase NtrB n=1 Tax=Fontibacillus sp. BL9 TaxID=3389971 RepID=UPI00397AA658